MREALDPEGDQDVCLFPDPELKADLCAPRWRVNLRGVQVDSKEDIIKRLGRSPDKGDSAVYSIAEIELATIRDGEFIRVETQTEQEFGGGGTPPWEIW